MLSGFWAVRYHGRLYTACASHSEALAIATALPGLEQRIASAAKEFTGYGIRVG